MNGWAVVLVEAVTGASNWAAILVGLGLGGVVVEIVRSILHRKGMDASAAKSVTETALSLVAPLKERIAELEKELTTTEERASELDTDLKAATATVVRLTREVVAMTNAMADCHTELAEFRKTLGPHISE